jgi:hypothetical protein
MMHKELQKSDRIEPQPWWNTIQHALVECVQRLWQMVQRLFYLERAVTLGKGIQLARRPTKPIKCQNAGLNESHAATNTYIP